MIERSAEAVTVVDSLAALLPVFASLVAELTVAVDPSRFVGRKTSRLYVQFDQPSQQEVILLVRADSQLDPPARQSRRRVGADVSRAHCA